MVPARSDLSRPRSSPTSTQPSVPENFLLKVQGGRDIYAPSWLVGHGQVDSPGYSKGRRTLDVEIRITPAGNLVVTRISHTSGPERNRVGLCGMMSQESTEKSSASQQQCA